MINKIGYGNILPTFQARVAILGSVVGDPNFKLSGNEFEEMCKKAESLGDDRDLVILSATKSEKISSDEAEYDVFQREANITAHVRGKIHSKTFEQIKVSAEYDNEEYWGSADFAANQARAEKMFNTSFIKIAKEFFETLK